MTVTIKFKMSILLRLKDKTCFVFFGKTFLLKSDNLTRAIEETQVCFVAVDNFVAIVNRGKRLAKHHSDIAARLKKRQSDCAVAFRAGESEMIVFRHFAIHKTSHPLCAFGVVVKLDLWESVKDRNTVEFDLFPRKIRRKVKAETRLHLVLVSLADSLRHLVPQHNQKDSFVSEEQTSFGDACLLNRGHGTAPRRVETSDCATRACVLAHVEARQIRRRKVNPEGDPTELFTFAGLGVSRVEELHTAKEYTRGKILQGFSAFHTEKKDCAFLALRLTRCVKNFLCHDVTR